jgi:hypothetical protein
VGRGRKTKAGQSIFFVYLRSPSSGHHRFYHKYSRVVLSNRVLSDVARTKQNKMLGTV